MAFAVDLEPNTLSIRPLIVSILFWLLLLISWVRMFVLCNDVLHTCRNLFSHRRFDPCRITFAFSFSLTSSASRSRTSPSPWHLPWWEAEVQRFRKILWKILPRRCHIGWKFNILRQKVTYEFARDIHDLVVLSNSIQEVSSKRIFWTSAGVAVSTWEGVNKKSFVSHLKRY